MLTRCIINPKKLLIYATMIPFFFKKNDTFIVKITMWTWQLAALFLLDGDKFYVSGNKIFFSNTAWSDSLLDLSFQLTLGPLSVFSHMNINQQKSPQLDQINLLMLSILIIGRNKLEENTFLFTYNNIMHIYGKYTTYYFTMQWS